MIAGRSFDWERSENGNGTRVTDPLQGMTTRHPPRDDSNPQPAIARSAGKSRGFAALVLRQGWSPEPAGNEATATARKAAPDRARQQPLQLFGSYGGVYVITRPQATKTAVQGLSKPGSSGFQREERLTSIGVEHGGGMTLVRCLTAASAAGSGIAAASFHC
jgi:hypothetical protein